MLDQLLRKRADGGWDGAGVAGVVADVAGGWGESLPIDVTVFGIGEDAAIVFLPGEVFVELGLAIKQASPYRTTLVVELSQCASRRFISRRGRGRWVAGIEGDEFAGEEGVRVSCWWRRRWGCCGSRGRVLRALMSGARWSLAAASLRGSSRRSEMATDGSRGTLVREVRGENPPARRRA